MVVYSGYCSSLVSKDWILFTFRYLFPPGKKQFKGGRIYFGSLLEEMESMTVMKAPLQTWGRPCVCSQEAESVGMCWAVRPTQ